MILLIPFSKITFVPLNAISNFNLNFSTLITVTIHSTHVSTHASHPENATHLRYNPSKTASQ